MKHNLLVFLTIQYRRKLLQVTNKDLRFIPIYEPYNKTRCTQTDTKPLYDGYLLMLRTKTNRRTDEEQYTRSNAATARPRTLLRTAETF